MYSNVRIRASGDVAVEIYTYARAVFQMRVLLLLLTTSLASILFVEKHVQKICGRARIQCACVIITCDRIRRVHQLGDDKGSSLPLRVPPNRCTLLLELTNKEVMGAGGVFTVSSIITADMYTLRVRGIHRLSTIAFHNG